MKRIKELFYDVDYTIGDEFDDNTMYFHAYFNRENPTTIQRDFQVLPRVSGSGRFLGCNMGIIINEEKYLASWWGEGEIKMYIMSEPVGQDSEPRRTVSHSKVPSSTIGRICR